LPRRTALGRLVTTLGAGHTPTHPLFDVAGWWRRPERLTVGAGRLASTGLSADRPLLIIGASGTLSRAFQRICTLRGLPVQVYGRTELDIADAAAIDGLIHRLHPWAVVNTAGYVQVDEAQRNPELCLRINAIGAANLAAACGRRGLPLVTYSSDLVFDGTKGERYDETDTPCPLNVYGASKAEAERRVLALFPDALVIRTSAFFGPWDEHNFLAQLFDALDRGQTFRAGHDEVVSPTYVPDLVHASLDLLIDQERGLWHLANDGRVSWYDFAVCAALRSGRRVDLIAPVNVATIAGAAARPGFTPLTSCRAQLLRPLDAALSAFLGEMDGRQLRQQRSASPQATEN
jgi:dTDP-4-dehydrorhamnose reductase